MEIFSLFLLMSTLNGLSKAGLLHKDETSKETSNEPLNLVDSAVNLNDSTVLEKEETETEVETPEAEPAKTKTPPPITLAKEPRSRLEASSSSSSFSSRMDTSSLTPYTDFVLPYQVQASSYFDSFKAQARITMAKTIHSVGSIIPLRGLASIGVDLGIPGAAAFYDYLMSTDFIFANSRKDEIPRNPKGSSIDRFDHYYGATSPAASPTYSGEPTSLAVTYRDEMSSLIGAVVYGEEQCMLKLACLSGKRISTVNGATSATVLMSAAAGYMPDNMRTTYNALRDSLIYTGNCDHYVCTHDLPQQQRRQQQQPQNHHGAMEDL